jgi:hypothetical protein
MCRGIQVCLTNGSCFQCILLMAFDDRWHWRAFLNGGGSAFWLLAYGIFYWASQLRLDSFSSVVLYLGYLFLLVVLDFLITGEHPFLNCSTTNSALFLQEPSASSHHIGQFVDSIVPFVLINVKRPCIIDRGNGLCPFS